MRYLNKVVAIALALVMGAPVTTQICHAQTKEVFYEDFSSNTIDHSKWLIANKKWGGTNGGVVPENVSVSNGTLKLEGHGKLYEGAVQGIGKTGNKLVGGAIATKEYYGAGSYEIRAKVAPELGACSAMWTYEYEEYYKGDPEYEKLNGKGEYVTATHEIDIEIPTALDGGTKNVSFRNARFNTWQSDYDDESNFRDTGINNADGNWHTYRFDWHTDESNPHVDFYIDGVLKQTNTRYIPYKEGRLWIGVWFPKWAGDANFDTTVFEVDYVKITPFNESGCQPQNETYPDGYWYIPEEVEDTKNDENKNEPNTGDNKESLDTEEKYDKDDTNKNDGTETEEQPSSEGILLDNLDTWKLTAKATVDNGVFTLSSGNSTDTIETEVAVKPNTDYCMYMDITTSGAEVTGVVKDYAGKYTSIEQSTSKTKTIAIPFTTTNVSKIRVGARVLRYQNNTEPCTVTNIRLAEGIKDIEEEIEPTPAPEPEQPTEQEEVANMDWKLGGSAYVNGTTYCLASGSNTDTITKTVDVQGGHTYRLRAHVETTGANVELGVRDYNGRYTNLNTTTSKSGDIEVVFTVASHMKSVELYGQVLRYQSNTDTCGISNIVFEEI